MFMERDDRHLGPRRSSWGNDRGTSLVEVLVAIGISAVAIGPIATLLGAGASSLRLAHETSMAAVLAARKMEQLKGAIWAVDAAGVSFSDTSTDFAAPPPPPPAGGHGLTPSPPSSLSENRAGHVDFLDAAGRWVGAGDTAPPGTAYVRRWSVEPVPDDPGDTLVLQVLVVPRARLARAGHVHSGREPGVVRLVSARTRKFP